jgi:hypothetical protein
MTDANGNFKQVVWWILGIMGSLLIAGVIGSIGTFAAVRALDTNVSLMRVEVGRDSDRQEQAIQNLRNRLESHITATQREKGGGP